MSGAVVRPPDRHGRKFMCDLNTPSIPSDDMRLSTLERLVLELTKHISAAQPLPPGAVYAIEELKLRHPDV